MKKILLIIIFLLIPFNIYAHEQLSDGWHVVKAIEKTDDCKLNYVWGYYKKGVEVERVCAFVQVHRAWGEAPENSLSAIKMTKEKGYRCFETDIQFTKDNVAVLSHDPTINRIARNKDFTEISERIRISKYTLNELKNYIFVTTRNGEVLKNYPNNKITTFKEALKYSKDNKLFITIELKSGSIDQLTALVKMVKDYKMENSVRYISFQPKLIERIKSIDEYADIGIIDRSSHMETGICDPDVSSRYCKSITEKGKDEGQKQRDFFHKLLDTGHNFLRMSGDKSPNSQGQGTFYSVNLPDSIDKYPASKYKLDLIQKGKISANLKSISLKNGETKTISYTYNGDGTVKCSNSNTTYVTCSVNSKKKEISIKSASSIDKDVTISIYATQGVKYSATADAPIKIKLSKESALLMGDVNGDGKINAFDYILIRKYTLGYSELKTDELKRTDIDGNNNVGVSDYIKLRKIILENK